VPVGLVDAQFAAVLVNAIQAYGYHGRVQ
jgi:hypothetical protein